MPDVTKSSVLTSPSLKPTNRIFNFHSIVVLMFTKSLFSPFGFFTAIVWNVVSRILPERRFCYLWCERWKISSNLSKSKHLLSCANQPANHHHCHLQHWFGTFSCQKLYNKKIFRDSKVVNAKKDKFQGQKSWHQLDCISRSPTRGMQWKSEKEKNRRPVSSCKWWARRKSCGNKIQFKEWEKYFWKVFEARKDHRRVRMRSNSNWVESWEMRWHARENINEVVFGDGKQGFGLNPTKATQTRF